MYIENAYYETKETCIGYNIICYIIPLSNDLFIL